MENFDEEIENVSAEIIDLLGEHGRMSMEDIASHLGRSMALVEAAVARLFAIKQQLNAQTVYELR